MNTVRMLLMDTVHMLFDFDKAQLIADSQTPGGPPSEVDKVKVAALCELSWLQRGWKVNRVNLKDWQACLWEGKARRQLGAYSWLNNWWFATRELEPGLFITADVFNSHFTPGDYDDPNWTEPYSMGVNFSLAALHLTPGSSEKILQALHAHQRGQIDGEITELSLNAFLQAPCRGIMSYAFAEQQWQTYPLTHFTRSAMQWAI